MTQDEMDSEMITPVLPAPPLDGWTLDNLPDNLPKHTELIRGTLVVSPQKAWHLFAIRMIEYALVRQAPEEFLVFREMAIRKSKRSAPEPDLSIVDASAVNLDKSIYVPAEVALVAEVISPESEERDREDKPVLYAMMGIPTFWLIERGEDDTPIVHEHYLYAGVYKLMKTHSGRLTTSVPFPIDIPLTVPSR